jgi:HD-GYP domain-containing protein (c-di-GMP phosphodiesterase class II)
MLRVFIQHAREGMKLAMPVLHPRTGKVLLKPGFVLDDRLIEKLRELAVSECWVEYPSNEEIRHYISPVIQQRKAEVTSLIADLFEGVHHDAHARLDFVEYRRVLRSLIEELALDPEAAAYFTEMGGTCNNELRHASEVCFLSILLGMKLRDYIAHERPRLPKKDACNVVALGIGAMVHDIGKRDLDEETRTRCHVTADESDPRWQEHVTIGFRMLSGSIRPASAGIILQHHQYFDGSGFPREIETEDDEARGMHGSEIHVFARIVCVANHFDRLRRRPDGSMMPRVRVLRQMLDGQFTPRFDPVILHMLPQVAPAYPPGSMVRLSNHEHAVVVGWDPRHPCRPPVRILPPNVLAGDTMEQPGERIELLQQTDLAIVEHDGFDVAADNFDLAEYLPHEPEEQRDAA